LRTRNNAGAVDSVISLPGSSRPCSAGDTNRNGLGQFVEPSISHYCLPSA